MAAWLDWTRPRYWFTCDLRVVYLLLCDRVFFRESLVALEIELRGAELRLRLLELALGLGQRVLIGPWIDDREQVALLQPSGPLETRAAQAGR